MTKPLLQVKNLKMYFNVNIPTGMFSKERRQLKAVDDVSFEVYPGETLGVVGESGCGKSTTARGILQLIRPTAGEVWLDDTNLTTLEPKKLRACRQQIQMVFQDPYASLNPRMTVVDIVSEPAKVFGLHKKPNGRLDKKALTEATVSIMEKVGLERKFMNRYPHAFSGGQRQRIGIARALISSPKIIVADEPVSALDVSIQAQVLNLFADLQEEYKLTYVFIAHDLSVIRHMSTRIAVMYLGRLAEIAPAKALFAKPLHPYTEALISAVNVPDPEIEKKRKRIVLKGDVPSPINPPKGCPFHTRCPKAQERCSLERPVLETKSEGHQVACFFPNE